MRRYSELNQGVPFYLSADFFHLGAVSFSTPLRFRKLAKIWAKVGAQCKRNGRRLEAGDAWIAATAIHRRIPLLTHDRDYVGLEIDGLQVISYAADCLD